MRYLTDEELNVASRFLFLSMAISVIEQDIQSVDRNAFIIKAPYFSLFRKMISNACHERKQLKKEIRTKEIQVVSLEKDHVFSSYLFVCREREEKRHYFNPAMRKKVEAIIYELIIKVQQPYSHFFGRVDK